MISSIVSFVVAHRYVFIGIGIIPILMMLTLITSFFVKKDGQIVILKTSWMMKFRCFTKIPIATLIVFNESFGEDIPQVAKRLAEKPTNLCSFFWSSLLSIIIMYPLNLAFFSAFIGIAIIVAPFYGIVKGLQFLIPWLKSKLKKLWVRAPKPKESVRFKLKKSKSKKIDVWANYLHTDLRYQNYRAGWSYAGWKKQCAEVNEMLKTIEKPFTSKKQFSKVVHDVYLGGGGSTSGMLYGVLILTVRELVADNSYDTRFRSILRSDRAELDKDDMEFWRQMVKNIDRLKVKKHNQAYLEYLKSLDVKEKLREKRRQAWQRKKDALYSIYRRHLCPLISYK